LWVRAKICGSFSIIHRIRSTVLKTQI